MMCLCENNQIESWQIQMGENETLRIIWLCMVHNIACVMLNQQFFETETKTQSFKNKHIVIPEIVGLICEKIVHFMIKA